MTDDTTPRTHAGDHPGSPATATRSIEDLPASRSTPAEGDPAGLPRDDVPPVGTSAAADAPAAGNEPDPDGPDDHDVGDADAPDAEGLAESPGPGGAPPLG